MHNRELEKNLTPREINLGEIISFIEKCNCLKKYIYNYTNLMYNNKKNQSLFEKANNLIHE